MAVEDDIRACLGEKLAQYAANKHRGGSSGAKGTRYEDHFATWMLVQAAAAFIEDPSTGDPHVTSQTLGFVDDLRVSSNLSTDYFQLKNAATVSWTSGEHPIAADFNYQFLLSKHRGEPTPRTNLTVSDAGLAVALSGSIPVDIRCHTAVLNFPGWRLRID